MNPESRMRKRLSLSLSLYVRDEEIKRDRKREREKEEPERRDEKLDLQICPDYYEIARLPEQRSSTRIYFSSRHKSIYIKKEREEYSQRRFLLFLLRFHQFSSLRFCLFLSPLPRRAALIAKLGHKKICLRVGVVWVEIIRIKSRKSDSTKDKLRERERGRANSKESSTTG